MPDPTPKAADTLLGHRTKAELNLRKAGEKALATGIKMRESPAVKADSVAHRTWAQLQKLYKAIDKNDALVENVVNRYCLMTSECSRFETEDTRIREKIDELEERRDDLEYSEYIQASTALEKCLQSNAKALQDKRKMLFEIEKENLMTLQGQIRSIQKKPETKSKSSMAKFLEKRQENA